LLPHDLVEDGSETALEIGDPDDLLHGRVSSPSYEAGYEA
jgi:hypothetical protein